MFKALYDFQGQSAGEMGVTKDEIILIEKQEGNGKFSSGNSQKSGANNVKQDGGLQSVKTIHHKPAGFPLPTWSLTLLPPMA